MKETADTENCTPVAVKPLRGLRGVLSAATFGGISVERRQAKQAIAERIVEDAG